MQAVRCLAAALALLIANLAIAQENAPAEPPRPAAPAPDPIADDIPAYARAVSVSSMASAARGTILNLRSDDTPQQIADWYRAEFARLGWLIEKQDGTERQHLVTAFKSGRRASLLVTAKPVEGANDRLESQILLVVTEER